MMLRLLILMLAFSYYCDSVPSDSLKISRAFKSELKRAPPSSTTVASSSSTAIENVALNSTAIERVDLSASQSRVGRDLLNVNNMKLIYQLIDLFDISKLITSESDRKLMFDLLERFQIPKENLNSIEALIKLSQKFNENKEKSLSESSATSNQFKNDDKTIDTNLFGKFKNLIGADSDWSDMKSLDELITI